MDVFGLLDQRIREKLRAMGFVRPTPPQLEAIPEILRGKNLLLIAPTGTGKTEAAMLPIFHKLLNEWGGPGIKVIYITPLRALNRDIFRRLLKLAEELQITVDLRHGDTPRAVRRRIIESPPDILITTPETFQALLVLKQYRPHLRGVRAVIVDEVHELAESKRGVQLSVALERLYDYVEREFQRIGLSATIGDVVGVAGLLFGSGRDYVVKNVFSPRELSITVEYVDWENLPERLMKIMEGRRTSIVFVNTRQMAERLTELLKSKLPDLKVSVHHSSVSRALREETERMLIKGDLNLVVSTSSLELGIDVGHIDLVIQLGSPREVVRLVQRVGRARHRFGEPSEGIVIVTNLDEGLEAAVIAGRAMGGLLEAPRIPHKPLDVLAHQLVGYIIEHGRVDLYRFYRILKRSWPYRDLTVEEFMAVAEFMEKLRCIRIYVDGEVKARIGKRAFSYYFDNLSTIPDTVYLRAYDLVTGREIGLLDLDYAERSLREGLLIVLAGRAWEIVGIDLEGLRVSLRPALEADAVPVWYGETIPVPREVAEEMALLRRRITELLGKGLNPEVALRGYPVEEGLSKMIVQQLAEHLKLGYPLPTPDQLLVEQIGNIVVLHCCQGVRINRAVAALVAGALYYRFSIAAYYVVDACRILLYSRGRIPGQAVEVVLREWLPETVRTNPALIRRILKATYAYQEKLLQVARRFGAVRREARKRPSAQVLVEQYEGTPVEMEAFKELAEDYMDLEGALRLIEGLGSGKVRLLSYESQTPSPLSNGMFEYYGIGRTVLKLSSTEAVIRAVRERLKSSNVRLICLYCGWETLAKVSTLKDRLKCPKCGSLVVAAAKPGDELAKRVAEKLRKGGRLRGELAKKLRELWLSAELVVNYGRKAVEVMAGRGVGPSTAAKIFSRWAGDESELYKLVLAAELDFEKTRHYWQGKR